MKGLNFVKIGTKDKEFILAFKTLGDINRYRIFRSLMKKKNMTVSDIAKTLNISSPLTSQHLKLFLLKGLLNKNKQSREAYYSLNLDEPSVRSIIKVLPIN
jgi:DNA-binding transcriptional ArsR family regulator